VKGRYVTRGSPSTEADIVTFMVAGLPLVVAGSWRGADAAARQTAAPPLPRDEKVAG